MVLLELWVVTETTARLDLPVHDDYKNINASFYFQLQTENSVLSLLPAQTTRPTDPGIRQSLTATFTNLNAGKQYNGRMIMEIQNMKATLKGEWCNFTTKCQSSSSYSVQVDERMLSISKSLNQDVPHNCPDSWYTVELLPSRQTLSGVWPVQLSDLPPGTLFQVQVKGLDGSLQLQKDVKTLEAAPSKVINLEVESVDSTSVELSWYPPVHPNGNITGYKIVVQLRYYKGCLEKKQQLISDFYENKTITISPDVTSWKIVGLKPYGGYYLLVSAYHSKAGLENGTPVATRALRIPTEKFEDLKFIVENSTLTWKDPDCSTVTGPIAGAVVIFSGQSNDVKNFHHSEMTQDLSFELNSFKSKHIIIHGQETYQVKIYVSRDVKGANYNPIACTSLNFTTPPSAPPRVENLDLVEVNSATNWSTLRWQKPLSPRNGDISHYAIVFAGNGQSRSFNVGVDSICPLWKNWLCKDIQNNAVPSKFIKVVAYNKGAEESGPESQIVNRLTEKGADAPQKVSYPCIGNGIVNLTWSHPWRTGGPLVKFIITIDVISTNLSRPLWKNQTTSFITIPVNKSTYQPFYIECIDLLPSTSYALHIQGFGKIYPGGVAHVNVTIPPAFGFDRIESPVVNAEESQINIVIPAILNDTVTNIMDVIVIGPRRCENTEMISDVLKNQLQLDPYTDAWSVATFSTSDRANTQFTIGDGKLYYNIYNNTNCPVFDGSYRYAFLLRDGESSNSVKSEKLLSWTSDPIKIGNDIIMETSPAGWIVPLVLILLIICGVGWFFVRRHRKRSVIIETDTKSDDDLPLPLLEPRKNPRGPHNGMNLLEKQESIEQVGDDVNIRGLVPTPKKIPKKHLSLVKLREFHDYVRNGIASGELVEQYDTFPRGQTQSWDYGQLPHNRSKNRYANLIAYDETRVKLVKLPNEPCSDYINANYVRGYKKNKAYIATQGPKSNTLDDFWRMVWQERVQVICMLANVMEGGKKKCEKYWPDIEKKCEFGGISVDNINHTTFADYTFRIFNVTCGQETRKVEHLHYTAWPDHGVPHYTQSVVTYLKKLLATNTGHGPVVVHCSAGVGRTGTIILCDICLRRAAAEGVVDVFAETEILRTQRPNMVDNRQQYLLAHLTLVECLLTLSTAMPCNETLPAKIQEQKRQLSQQLQRLDECVWQDEALQSSPSKSIEISKGNLHKNRYPELAAVVGQKIQISRYPASDPDSDYIFGVFVDSARNKNNYLASQLPLPSTLNDFWRMVAEFRVELIIALQSPRENDHTCCEFVLRDDTEVKPTSFITLRRKNRIEEDICYSEKILLTDSSGKSSREQPVTVLSLKGWQSGESKQPPKPITLVDFWQYAERIPRGDGPTVVLCDDGVTSCGLYLALSFLLERMGLERECDVSLAIRAIRRSRPDFCTTPEQLEYLYDAAVIYTDYFETYANFT
uniref:protein-tyrosine-phosphatase n=1 Tax=Fopius arisanus TaxID=64838 RepID=A0A0C9S1P6_9HYME